MFSLSRQLEREVQTLAPLSPPNSWPITAWSECEYQIVSFGKLHKCWIVWQRLKRSETRNKTFLDACPTILLSGTETSQSFPPYAAIGQIELEFDSVASETVHCSYNFKLTETLIPTTLGVYKGSRCFSTICSSRMLTYGKVWIYAWIIKTSLNAYWWSVMWYKVCCVAAFLRCSFKTSTD